MQAGKTLHPGRSANEGTEPCHPWRLCCPTLLQGPLEMPSAPRTSHCHVKRCAQSLSIAVLLWWRWHDQWTEDALCETGEPLQLWSIALGPLRHGKDLVRTERTAHVVMMKGIHEWIQTNERCDLAQFPQASSEQGALSDDGRPLPFKTNGGPICICNFRWSFQNKNQSVIILVRMLKRFRLDLPCAVSVREEECICRQFCSTCPMVNNEEALQTHCQAPPGNPQALSKNTECSSSCQGKTTWLDSAACADCPGLLVLGAAGARLPASSRSLRLCPELFPSWPRGQICWPQLPYHPCKHGTHSTRFCNTREHTLTVVMAIGIHSMPWHWSYVCSVMGKVLPRPCNNGLWQSVRLSLCL